MGFRVSKAAGRDLESIFEFGIRTFGRKRALTYAKDMRLAFRHIAANPFLNRERPEADPPLRIHVFHSHLILYRIEEADILIARVLHGREDWQSGIEF
jgi:toxin ParE1/3/4